MIEQILLRSAEILLNSWYRMVLANGEDSGSGPSVPIVINITSYKQ
jgi:hypothetical protein